ncbi:MAG: hypothetical protein QM727_11700 [Niabella sp.]
MEQKETKTNKEARQIFVSQKVQPALLGFMDGSVSTLAPIFASAGLTEKPMSAFYVGLAASLGAGISMGLAESLTDDGTITGRGNPVTRGIITGLGTALGGMFHTFPFLLSDYHLALKVAYCVVVFELMAIALVKYKFMRTKLVPTIIQVIVGGAIVFFIGLYFGDKT